MDEYGEPEEGMPLMPWPATPSKRTLHDSKRLELQELDALGLGEGFHIRDAKSVLISDRSHLLFHRTNTKKAITLPKRDYEKTAYALWLAVQDQKTSEARANLEY
jgi:hypothetical protein